MINKKRFALLSGQPVPTTPARVPAGKTKGVYLPTFLINNIEAEVRARRMKGEETSFAGIVQEILADFYYSKENKPEQEEKEAA